ncbi:MAG: hypothetical protein NWE98_02350 [Candidatus Bathyarchaeota archaeon]|nr:hypothetical protein [Candidatus Bathyarchaeota archaeon]
MSKLRSKKLVFGKGLIHHLSQQSTFTVNMVKILWVWNWHAYIGCWRMSALNITLAKEIAQNISAEFDPFIVEEIKLFGSQITDFWNKFNRVSEMWENNRNTTLQYHGLLVSLIGIFAAIIADTLLTLLKP